MQKQSSKKHADFKEVVRFNVGQDANPDIICIPVVEDNAPGSRTGVVTRSQLQYLTSTGAPTQIQ